MAKLYAKHQIVLPDDVIVLPKSVFDATPAQAKQFDKLSAARPATAAEVKEADAAEAARNGVAF
ncbi:hypothetical protein [Pseudogemmobacter sonorensis]|uniref:hypothetical protein n=1 Tax=Pseudogemmobacter sonorensis TaxID=2989681 RepID=UPI0036B02722